MEERVLSEPLRGCKQVILQESAFMATTTTRKVAKESPPNDDGRGIPEDGKLLLPEIDGHQLVVDEEIRGAIPPLSHDEREGLYNSLRVHGLFTPITLVEMPDGTRMILDGKERMELWARICHEIEDWKPPLSLRADVLPLSDIVGDQKDPGACSALVIARAIAINTARRQLTRENVSELIRKQLLREYEAGLQRSSTWLAAELGVALSWLIDVRKDMWDRRVIPCPTTVLTKTGGYQSNSAFKVKPSRSDTLIKARSLPPSGVFEEEPKPQVTQQEAMTEAITEAVAEETAAQEEAEDFKENEEISEEPDVQMQEMFPEVEADCIRFREEMSVLTLWNSQREKPLPKQVLNTLWANDLVEIEISTHEVCLLLDRSKLEGLLVALITPIVRELDIPEIKVTEAVHSLLNPPAPKARKK